MRDLVTYSLIGLLAQFVAGTLGMAHGVISTTLLLGAGLPPATASASVHVAEIGTAFASGTAHSRFDNVEWPVVWRVGLPGAVGGFAGALALSYVSTELAKPWMAGVLAVLGGYLLIRFGLRPQRGDRPRGTLRSRFLAPLGGFAGFLNASGGGGWGPVVTPALLATGRMEPRRVIGSAGTSQFLVALAATLGFLIGLGVAGLSWPAVVGLLLGGLVAAPVAAWLARLVPGPVLGASAGGLILLLNARTVLETLGVGGGGRAVGYAVIVALWLFAFGLALRTVMRAREARPAADPG
jgi:hypothetical protein